MHFINRKISHSLKRRKTNGFPIRRLSGHQSQGQEGGLALPMGWDSMVFAENSLPALPAHLSPLPALPRSQAPARCYCRVISGPPRWPLLLVPPQPILSPKNQGDRLLASRLGLLLGSDSPAAPTPSHETPVLARPICRLTCPCSLWPPSHRALCLAPTRSPPAGGSAWLSVGTEKCSLSLECPTAPLG